MDNSIWIFPIHVLEGTLLRFSGSGPERSRRGQGLPVNTYIERDSNLGLEFCACKFCNQGLEFLRKILREVSIFFCANHKTIFLQGCGWRRVCAIRRNEGFQLYVKAGARFKFGQNRLQPTRFAKEMSGREHLNAIFPWNFRNMIPKALANTQKTLGKVLPRCREACTTHEGSIALELQRVLQMMWKMFINNRKS